MTVVDRRPPPAPVPIPGPAAGRRLLQERDGGACRNCDEVTDDWHVDHVFPIWLVDPTDPERWRYWLLENLQTLCRSCHQAKTNAEAANRAKVKRIVSMVRTPMGAKKRPRQRRPSIPF